MKIEIRCVACKRLERPKNTIKEPVRKFLNLDEAYVRDADDYIRLAELVRRNNGKLRWLCAWCYGVIDNQFCGKLAQRRKDRLPSPWNVSAEAYQLYSVAMLAKRLKKEAALVRRF